MIGIEIWHRIYIPRLFPALLRVIYIHGIRDERHHSEMEMSGGIGCIPAVAYSTKLGFVRYYRQRPDINSVQMRIIVHSPFGGKCYYYISSLTGHVACIQNPFNFRCGMNGCSLLLEDINAFMCN